MPAREVPRSSLQLMLFGNPETCQLLLDYENVGMLVQPIGPRARTSSAQAIICSERVSAFILEP